MPVTLEIRPNNGGINVEPVYAPAICTPIIAREFSSPKFEGVECIIDGYTVAQPSPSTTSPIKLI